MYKRTQRRTLTKDWPPEKFYGTLAKEEIRHSILIELKKNRSGLEDEILANILNLPKQEIQDHLDILALSYFIQIEKTMGPSYFAYIRPEGLQKLDQIESECLPKSN